MALPPWARMSLLVARSARTPGSMHVSLTLRNAERRSQQPFDSLPLAMAVLKPQVDETGGEDRVEKEVAQKLRPPTTLGAEGTSKRTNRPRKAVGTFPRDFPQVSGRTEQQEVHLPERR